MSIHGRRSPTVPPALCAALLSALLLAVGCNMITGADDVSLVGDGGASSSTTATGAGGVGGTSSSGGSAPGGGPVSPCDGVDCADAGDCVDVGGEAACDCDAGHHAEGLSCVEDPPPGPCEDVTCGTNAACEGGDCVCDGGYEGDPTAGCTAINADEAAARAELVAIATAELGYCEGPDDRPYMQGQPGLWCYDFVAWVYQQSSYSLPSPISLPHHTVGSIPAWWRPEPGDLIKFNIQHYGMVADVSANGQIITTIEGNVSLCVRSRSTSDPSVEYYGTLDNVF